MITCWTGCFAAQWFAVQECDARMFNYYSKAGYKKFIKLNYLFSSPLGAEGQNLTTMQKGQIRVHTENIFPIIKKFLYSDHEIFLRELMSNAVDASQKLKTLSSIGEAKGEIGDLRIDIVLDAKEKTLSIIDKGVGMTAEE